MWETIKKILRRNSGTCIIVENGKPAFVVTTFEAFQEFLGEQEEKKNNEKDVTDEHKILERINQEIIDWKIRQRENNPEIADLENEDLKIEDLPLV